MKDKLIYELEYNTTMYLDMHNIYDDYGNRINKQLEVLFYNGTIENLIDHRIIWEIMGQVDFKDLLRSIYYYNKDKEV